jgi:hypothetical protein
MTKPYKWQFNNNNNKGTKRDDKRADLDHPEIPFNIIVLKEINLFTLDAVKLLLMNPLLSFVELPNKAVESPPPLSFCLKSIL